MRYFYYINKINNISRLKEVKMHMKKQTNNNSKANIQIPSQERMFQQFLKQNNLKMIDLHEADSDEAQEQNHKRNQPNIIELNPQAMVNLRKRFRSQYLMYSKILNKNLKDEKRFEKKHSQQLKSQHKLNEKKRINLQQRQKNALLFKNKHLNKKAEKINVNLKKWQQKIETNYHIYKKQIKKSIEKVKMWENKIEESCEKKSEMLSRISSTSKIHNNHVNQILSKQRSDQQFKNQCRILQFEYKEQLTRSRRSSKNNLNRSYSIRSLATSSCGSRISHMNKNRQNFIKNLDKEQRNLLTKSIKKEQKIEKARHTKTQQNTSKLQTALEKRRQLKYKMNQNIAQLIRKRREKDRKLQMKFSKPIIRNNEYNSYRVSPSSSNTINYEEITEKKHDLLPLVNKQKSSEIYLTEIPEKDYRKKQANDSQKNNRYRCEPRYSNTNKSVQDFVNNYKRSANIQRNSLKMEQLESQDIAARYNSAILTKLRNMSAKVRNDQKVNRSSRNSRYQ